MKAQQSVAVQKITLQNQHSGKRVELNLEMSFSPGERICWYETFISA